MIKIETAKRESTFTLTSIAGPSGSGKTHSSIRYARGLVGPDGKIGFIDTENKRSRHHTHVGGGFDVHDLRAPFTPSRYIEAIDAFEQAGFGVLVIDSMSHEWDGIGGVVEMAEDIEVRSGKTGLHCWNKPKREHKRLMARLLQSQMHIVFCCRAKEVHKQVKKGGRTEVVNEGYIPILEKNFIFEMTISMMLDPVTNRPTFTKCPDLLVPRFKAYGRIDESAGDIVREWAEDGVKMDRDVEALHETARLRAMAGSKKFKEWYALQDDVEQGTVSLIGDEIRSIMNSADEVKQMTDDVIKVDEVTSEVHLGGDTEETPPEPAQDDIFSSPETADA